jgi:carotenoid cleavage dioxygenase-like enzyme
MMHDCALTEDYFILLDMPLCFDPEVRYGALASVMISRSSWHGTVQHAGPAKTCT